MTSPTTRLSVAELSGLPQADFVRRLADIFEHSPWIPERTWRPDRPFESIEQLHAACLDTLAKASPAEQLQLVRAHPELAGREAAAGTLTQASTGEQRGAGLDQCSPEELLRLHALNAAYRERFGFPFVVAVKGLTRRQILDRAAARLANDPGTELRACLEEIGRIARFRLDALLS